MRSIIFSFLLSPILYYSQIIKTDTSLSTHSFSIGSANTGEIILSNNNSPSYLLSYNYHVDSLTSFKFDVTSKIYSDKSSFLLEFNDFHLSSYMLKTKFIDKRHRLSINYGLGAYFRMNLRRYKISFSSGSSWNSDYYGFGILLESSINYKLTSDLSIFSESNLGIGFHQNYINNGISSIAQEVWEINSNSIKILSIGINYIIPYYR